MKCNPLLLGLLIGGAVFNSAALTLGRVRGAAWIGQPLSLSVPVQLDSAKADPNLCAEADVYYADAMQDPARVRVVQAPDAQADTQVVQILSAVNIDEPMVTVYLRVGCGQKIGRRYVLLADYPSLAGPATAPVDTAPPAVDAVATPVPTESSPPLEATPLEAAAPAPAATPPEPGTRGARASTGAAKPAVRRAPRAAPTPAQKTPKPPKSANPAATGSPAAPVAAGGQGARLKLDPLENLSERIKTLETTTTAIPLEEIVRDAQRIQALQNDVKKLLDQAAKNEATLALMRERLEKAEAERISSTWLYTLSALVLACLAAIAVLWNRRSSGATLHHSWNTSQQDDNDEPVPPVRRSAPVMAPTAAASANGVATTVPAPVAAPPRDESGLEVDLVEMDVDADAYNELVHTVPATPGAAGDGPASAPQPVLGTALVANDFNADAQFDLRQQAEFFDRLGKTDEAIEVLEKRIRANSKDCPLIYLELLRIANARSLKTDFRQFRDECMQVFNVAVPEFAQFRNEGRALEAYPDVLAHIEKLWHTPKAVEVLESCILRDPWEKNSQAFDLAAFRELIVLHGLACQATPPAATAQQATAPSASKAPDAINIDFEL